MNKINFINIIDNYNSFKMSLKKQFNHDLLLIREFCLNHDIPIIRDDVADFVNLIIYISKSNNLLELGTAVGYSSINFALHNEKLQITTIDNYLERTKIAKENFNKLNLTTRFNLIEDDITNVLKQLINNNSKYDIIFLDAAKAQYINWIEDIKKLMNNNSILITDNIFNDNNSFLNKLSIEKRDRTIHTRMRSYLDYIFNDKDFISNIYNLGDGITVSIKNNE